MSGPAYIDAFRRILIQPDNVTIAADAVDDTLTLTAGPGISLVANAGSDQITIVNTNPAEFSFGVAGDDSSIKTINSGETIRFAGVGPIDIAADSEGAISISWDENAVDWASVVGPSIQATGLPVGTYGRDLSLESLTVDSVTIDTNVITTVDSNANLELRANGSGKVTIDSYNISLGRNAGLTNQGTNGVGVGTQAGQTNQGDFAVSVGSQAGSASQGTLAVAVGKDAGFSSQGVQSVAVGTSAGYSSQGTFSVALGSNAGIYTQGNYAVAIGYGAGHTNQTTGSIAINAGNSLLNTVGAGFHVNPIRAGDVGLLLKYNTTTKEITYTSDDILVGSISIENNTIQTVDSNANLELAANGSGIIKALDYFELSDGTSPQGEWTGFTPTWTAATSNPTVGDGLIEGRYKMVGKTVHVWMMMTMGSTTTFGTGEYKISLPVAARSIASVVLNLVMYDNGTRHYNSLAHNDYTTGGSLNNTSVTLFWDTGVVTESAPFTWADGDWFIISGTYESS